MYKSLLILYESWSTRCRDHFEPKLDAIWENFFTTQNWLLGGPFCVFGPKRWNSSTKHCYYCMNHDLRVLAIVLSANSPRFERLFWRPKIGSLEGHFGFLAQNAGNHVQIMANIVWIVIYALTRSFWAQTRRDLREFFDGPKLAPWSAIFGFWPKTLEIMYKSWKILYESWSTRCRDHFELQLDAIWENFLTAQNWLLGGPFWVIGPKRWKSCTNHSKYCRIVIYECSQSFWAQTRRDLRDFFDGPKFAPLRAMLGFWSETLEIMYKTWQILYESWSRRSRDHFEPNLASISETFLTAQNCLLRGPFWVFGPKRWKSCTSHC